MNVTRRLFLRHSAAAGAVGTAMTIPAASYPADPLLEAINAYRAGKAAFQAIPIGEITVASEPGFIAATYGPAEQALLANRRLPKATTLAGVREAIRLAFEEKALVDALVENALRSALSFLDGEAV